MIMVIGFDIEIAKVLPNASELRRQLSEASEAGASELELKALDEQIERAGDWNNFRPLGISCAAIHNSGCADNAALTTIYYSEFGRIYPYQTINERMDTLECRALLRALYYAMRDGTTIVTWNGAGFDIKVLADECEGDDGLGLEYFKMARELTLNHIDPMFDFFCHHGYAIGLDAACKGAGITGKTEGMSGALAPAMWAQGRAEQNQVLEYVAQDARITAELYLALLKKGRVDWISRRGRPCSWTFDRLRTVREALERPLPDVSWMDKPWTREKFVGWLDEPQY